MKPYVVLNVAMTLDGKIATRTGSSEISGPEDLVRVHELRKEMDAIMVGINTLLADDPRLTVHKISGESADNPLRIVVDSRARTPLDARILNNEAKTVVAVSEDAPAPKIKALQEEGEWITVVVAGKKQVDLNILMEKLTGMGIKSLMLEGGSTLNYSMLKEGLVREVRVCLAPIIAGGKDAKTLADGEGIDLMEDAFKLKLKKNYRLGKDLILEYDVIS